MVAIKGKEYLSKKEFSDAVGRSYNAISNWVLKGWIEPAYVSENGRQFFTSEQVEAYFRGDYFPVNRR